MKPLFLISFLLIPFACAPSKEQICEKIDQGIRKYLEKAASKQSREVHDYEVKTTDFEMVGAGRLDTLYKATYRRKITYFLARQKAAAGAEATAFLDSANYYDKLDSLTTLQIANRWQDPKVYYYSKTVVTDNGKPVDTARYALDQKFKLIPLL